MHLPVLYKVPLPQNIVSLIDFHHWRVVLFYNIKCIFYLRCTWFHGEVYLIYYIIFCQ